MKVFAAPRRALVVSMILPLLPSAAGATGANGETPDAVTLVVYDSFPANDTALNESLTRFTEQSGIGVDILVSGDTGTMVSKAVLTAGNPEGDVMFGVDNTYLSRVVDGDVFEPYKAAGLDRIVAEHVALVPDGEATPVDFGDVCVNYDIAWFETEGIEPPTDLASLTEPAYEDLLVVQNPASSSPGLAFLMATIDEFGDVAERDDGPPVSDDPMIEDRDGVPGWADYWNRLVDNGVEVVDGWTEAYYERFSGAGDGPRPLVVSYASSPPVEVLFADPPIDAPTTGVLADTCVRQIEFAGVLRGTDSPVEARQLVDFLISEDFQSEIALTLFVYPSNVDVELPQLFTDFAVQPANPATLDPDVVTANRERWIETWTDIVLR